MKDKRNELFQPRKDVVELIAAMRQIRGEEMYLFSNDTITEDTRYSGGARRQRIVVTETAPRRQPDRSSRAPSLTIPLSRASLEQLRSGNPVMFEKLIYIVKTFDEQQKEKTTTVRGVTPPIVEEIRQNTDRGRALLDAVINNRPRRSPRLAGDSDQTTEATVEIPLRGGLPPYRRSQRLAMLQT